MDTWLRASLSLAALDGQEGVSCSVASAVVVVTPVAAPVLAVTTEGGGPAAGAASPACPQSGSQSPQARPL